MSNIMDTEENNFNILIYHLDIRKQIEELYTTINGYEAHINFLIDKYCSKKP